LSNHTNTVNARAWFDCPDVLARWLLDLITQRTRILRPSFVPPLALQPLFAGDTVLADNAMLLIDKDHFDLDSIEIAEVAAALFVALDAESSGVLSQHAPGRTWGSWLAFSKLAASACAQQFFATSGSTGRAKYCAHSPAELAREVESLLPWFAASQRVVSLMPSQHVYGFLFGALLPTMLKLPVVAWRGAAPAQVRARLLPGDVLVAHPSFWQAALADDKRFVTGVIGLSSGQELDDSTFAAAADAGLTRLIELYGATETAGVGYRDSPGAFTLMARYQRAGAGLWDRARGVNVKAMDRIDFHSDQCFSVLGRVDRVVQVHGVNVSLDALEQTLMQLPNVSQARVRLRAHGRLEALLVAPNALSDAAVQAFFRQRLSAPHTPVRWQWAQSLPRNAQGKETDWA
jgi:long-chain acyl-CoA synthetase